MKDNRDGVFSVLLTVDIGDEAGKDGGKIPMNSIMCM